MLPRSHALCFIGLLWSLVLRTSLCWSVQGRIGENSVLPQLDDLGPDIRVALNEGDYTAKVGADGSFEFKKTPAGTYLLSVWSSIYTFPTLLIKVDEDGRVRSFHYNYEYDYPVGYFDSHEEGKDRSEGQPSQVPQASPLQYPLLLQAQMRLNFVHKRAQYNPILLLKSPMILMMVGSVVLLFLIPKIMSNLDPEEAAKMKESQNRLASALQGGDWKSALHGVMNPVGLEDTPKQDHGPIDSTPSKKGGTATSGDRPASQKVQSPQQPKSHRKRK